MTARKADADRLIAKRGEGIFKKKRGKNKHGAPLEARARGIDTGTLAGAMSVSEDKPLTEMQKSFVKIWASGDTILAASIKAGYADGGTYAYRMCRMPNILRLYNEEKRAFEAASNMSRKRVIDGLLEAIADAKLLEEPSTQVAGWKTIGQLCGYFAPVEIKHHVSVEGKVLIERMNRMSDEELFRLIAENAQHISAGQPSVLSAPDIEDVEPK